MWEARVNISGGEKTRMLPETAQAYKSSRDQEEESETGKRINRTTSE